MVERNVREVGKVGDMVANLQRNLPRNHMKVAGEDGEVQEEDLQRNLTVVEGDMVVATMEEK